MKQKISSFIDMIFSHFPVFISIIGVLLVMDLIMKAGLWTPLFWAFVGALIFLEIYFASIVRLIINSTQKHSYLHMIGHLSAFSFLAIFLFGILFAQFGGTENYLWNTIEMQKVSGFDNAYYFSGVTMFSIGYGDIVPYGFFRIIALVEGFIGSFIVVSFFSLGISHVFTQLKHSMKHEHHEIAESIEVLEKEVELTKTGR